MSTTTSALTNTSTTPPPPPTSTGTATTPITSPSTPTSTPAVSKEPTTTDDSSLSGILQNPSYLTWIENVIKGEGQLLDPYILTILGKLQKAGRFEVEMAHHVYSVILKALQVTGEELKKLETEFAPILLELVKNANISGDLSLEEAYIVFEKLKAFASTLPKTHIFKYLLTFIENKFKQLLNRLGSSK